MFVGVLMPDSITASLPGPSESGKCIWMKLESESFFPECLFSTFLVNP